MCVSWTEEVLRHLILDCIGVYIGIMENKMENKMETTIIGYVGTATR